MENAPSPEHKCEAFSLMDGVLVCRGCGNPSPSAKWKENIYGPSGKAVEQSQTANKAVSFPPESKRENRKMR